MLKSIYNCITKCCLCFQNELVFTDIITLSLNCAVSEEPEGAQQPRTGKASLA